MTCSSTTRTTRSTPRAKGEPVDVITPPQTILIQNPIAVTKTASPAAKAFLAYLLSPAGQTVWGQQGYRPVLPSVAAKFNFPKPKTLFTIDSLGGWTSVNTKFFDPQTGIVAKDEQSLGVSTASSVVSQMTGAGARVADLGLPGGRRAPAGRRPRRGRWRRTPRGRHRPPWPRRAGWPPASAARRSPSPTSRSSSCCRWPRWSPTPSATAGPSSGGAVTQPEAVAALELTLGLAAIVAVVNSVAGLAIAFVLVRDDFRGKALVGAVIDLPFALPTIVAGLTLLALYGPNSPFHVDLAGTRLGIACRAGSS